MLRICRKVQFHIIGDGEGRDNFLRAVKNTGCEVLYYGVVYDETEKIKILAPCDYGVNMMKDSVSVGLTIKSIDYFSYGLPIINNIKGDTWELVRKYGIGVNIDGKPYILPKLNHVDVIDCFYRYFTRHVFEETVLKEMGLFFERNQDNERLYDKRHHKKCMDW